MNLKEWVRFKNAARRNRDIPHWVSSPSGRDHGVVVTGADLVIMIEGIDIARALVRTFDCEDAPMDCVTERGKPCDVCAAKDALFKVVEDDIRQRHYPVYMS